jgi:hypothetical protein
MTQPMRATPGMVTITVARGWIIVVLALAAWGVFSLVGLGGWFLFHLIF